MSSVFDKHTPEIVLMCEGLNKTFTQGPADVEVLNDISLSIKKGEQIAIIGSSGSGKSTLLQLLGGLALPTKGRVEVNGHNVASLDETQRGRLRNQNLGFVYQFHHLLPEFSALENVAMPLLIRGLDTQEAKQRQMPDCPNIAVCTTKTHHQNPTH